VCHIFVSPAQPFSPIQSRKNKIGSRPQVNGTLIELLPVEERGRYVLGGFLDLGCSGFGTDDVMCSGIEEEWEKVLVHFNGDDDSEQFAEVHWKRDECNQPVTSRKK
jgi:hypothetical protein